MKQIEQLGNIELVNSFLTMHYITFGYTEDEMDKRIFEPCNISQKYLAELFHMPIHFFELNENILLPTEDENIKERYEEFFEEACKRGLPLADKVEKKNIIYTEEFYRWQISMRNRPTYIREIYANNLLGDYDISYADDEMIGFDYPTREACKILNEKGYHTYWSSANLDDAKRREGEVIKDKSVAYILIDSKNLTEKLKEKLLLNGSCDFWGVAVSHNDNGKYYGVWAEITSPALKCDEIKETLKNEALKLPTLIKDYHKEKRY